LTLAGALAVLITIACASTTASLATTPAVTPSVPPAATSTPVDVVTLAPTGPGSPSETTPDRPFGARTKDSGCTPHDGLPDSACTPGAVFPDVTADQICKPGYSSSVRNVPSEVSRSVYAEYGIVEHSAGEYEVDHLVPLEIGGSNDIANLWPEAAAPRPGFHEKDQVENYLHDQVCSGRMSLADAQRTAATDWLAGYDQMQQTSPRRRPTSAPATSGGQPTPNQGQSGQSGAAEIVSVTGAAPGGRASVTAQAPPGSTCSLAYTTPAGTSSRAQGLGTKTADASGTVSWSWEIGPSTRPGTGTVVVNCDGADVRSSIAIG
jgi:hypothetical protein